MENQNSLIKAQEVAKRTIRKNSQQRSMSPAQVRQKKMVMRQFKKHRYNKKEALRADQSLSRYLQDLTPDQLTKCGVFATVLLGFLSVSYTGLGFLSMACAFVTILIVLDRKSFQIEKQKEEKEQASEMNPKWIHTINSQKNRPKMIPQKSSPRNLTGKFAKLSEMTMTEFPYKHLRQ